MKCNSIIVSRVKCQNRVPISVVKFDQFRSNGSALARAIARASFDVCSDAYLRNLRRESFWPSLLLTSAAFHSRVTSGPSSEAKSGALNRLSFASLLSEVATIDPSSCPPRVPNRSASRRGPTASSSAHSSPRPASRQSQITNQIYQFALGYPQTPPDTSSDLDPFGPSIDAKSLIGGNSMGSFLFTWYAQWL